MEILITGGNGLLGRHLIPALQDRGDVRTGARAARRGYDLARAARRRRLPRRRPRAGYADRADERRRRAC